MSRVKWAAVIVAVCLVVLVAVAAAYAVGKAKTATPVDPLGVRDAKQFFRWYLAMRTKMQMRGEFETITAFQKRMPPPFDSQKTIYFSIQRDPIAKEYTYDSARGVLTLTAGQWGLASNLSFPVEGTDTSNCEDKWPYRLVV